MTGAANRVWIALCMVFVFVSGLSIGIAGTALIGPHMWAAFGRGPLRPEVSGERRVLAAERILDRLERDPDFTPAQRERVESLFAERTERLRAFNQEMRSRFATEQASLRGALADVLTPRQMSVFDETRRAGRRWWRRGPPAGHLRRQAVE